MDSDKKPLSDDNCFGQFAECRPGPQNTCCVLMGCFGLLLGVALLSLMTFMRMSPLVPLIFTLILTSISALACFCACHLAAPECREREEETVISGKGIPGSPPPEYTSQVDVEAERCSISFLKTAGCDEGIPDIPPPKYTPKGDGLSWQATKRAT